LVLNFSVMSISHPPISGASVSGQESFNQVGTCCTRNKSKALNQQDQESSAAEKATQQHRIMESSGQIPPTIAEFREGGD